MIWCSPSWPTRSSTFCWRTKGFEPLFARPAWSHHCHRGDDRGGPGPRLLLRAARRRPGLHPEDLLRPCAAGDRLSMRVRPRWSVRCRSPAHGGSKVGHALLRGDSHVADLHRGRIDNRLDLGQGVVGTLVGVERPDARLLSDRVPALRHLSAAALLDRGPRATGAIRERVRRRGRRLRAHELHRRSPLPGFRAPARAHAHRRSSARINAAHLRHLAARDRTPVCHSVEVRAGGQEHPDAASEAAACRARRGRGQTAGQERGAVMTVFAVAPALPLHTAGKYVAAAYIVFVVLILVYVAIMAVRLRRTERGLAQLRDEVAAREADRADERDLEEVA